MSSAQPVGTERQLGTLAAFAPGGLIGWVDYLLGRGISLALVYLVPVIAVAVLLRGADRQAAEIFALRLQALVREIGVSYPQSGLAASIGMVVYRARSMSGDALIRLADEAMYEVKARGKAWWLVRELDVPPTQLEEWKEHCARPRAR